MVIKISNLVIECNLLFIDEFKSINKYEVNDKPSYYINSYNEEYDLSLLKNKILETEYYDLYLVNGKKIQFQKDLTKEYLGVIEYDNNKVNIYNIKNTSFDLEYVLSQYAISYLVTTYSKSIFFHSSSIYYKGIGICFSAKSGTGKSTHRRLWNKYSDAICINDDKNIITLDNNKLLISPNPWSGKHMVDNNIKTELKAIVFLYQNKTNVVEELPLKKAFKLLLGQIELPKDDNIELWNNITDLMLKLPIYYLGCNMEKEAFTTIKERIDEDLCL